jgi:hypothetical protein
MASKPKYVFVMARQCGKHFIWDLVQQEKKANLPPRPERIAEFLRPLYEFLHGV